MALYKPPLQNSLQYTLDTAVGASDTTFTLNATITSTIQAPGIGWVDRVDSSGNKTPTKREYFSFTGVSGTNLTGVTRGVAGSTAQAHSVGAIVEFGPNITEQQAVYDAITTEHNTSGAHTAITASSASIAVLQVRTLLSASGASVVGVPTSDPLTLNNLSIVSQASLANVFVKTLFNASGASLVALPIRPAWVIPGTVSAASVAIGKPLNMPESGTIEWASVVLRAPISGASLLFDINKNFTSVFTDQNTRLTILGGGTYASTASVGTKIFSRGDVFTVDIDAGGWFSDATVQLGAR